MNDFTWDQLSVIAAVIAAVWSMSIWLNGKFNSGMEDRVKLQDKVMELLDGHEQKDQRRHEDNIQRFTKLETKLDILVRNGNGKH
jgi:hypothetical protein